MDYIRDTLPQEIIDLIRSFMNLKAKRIMRSTNKYWFNYIKLDEFTIYFARPKTLPNIVQHFQQLYGDQSIGLSLEKVVIGKLEDYPVQHLVQLTNLTSLSVKFSLGSLGSLKNEGTLTSLTNLLRLSPAHVNDGKFTNLTSIVYGNEKTRAHLTLYTKLRELTIGLYQYKGNPFELVANPSLLTKFDIGVSQMEVPLDCANLMTQFKNLKAMKYYQIADGTLPRIFQYLTGLERLELCRGFPQDDILLLTRLTSLIGISLVDRGDIIAQLSVFQNLKQLLIPRTKNESYSFLESLTALEELQLHYVGVSVGSEGLKFINSQKLTRLEINNAAEFFNSDLLSTLHTLRELRISEFMQNKVQKSYDALTSLTNLTFLYLLTQTPNSARLTVLNSLLHLKELKISSYNDVTYTHPDLTFSNLTNLEALVLGCCTSQTLYEGLSYLTQLTCVDINLSAEEFRQNPYVFSQMTQLRKLAFSKQVSSDRLWDWVTCLTNLEHLDVWRVDSEDIIESFSVLTNLKVLNMRRSHKVKGIHLTKLTTLQTLYFISKPARKLYEKNHLLIEKLTRLASKDFRS